MKVLNQNELKSRCYQAILNLSKVLGKDVEVVLRELEGMVDPENKEPILQARIHQEAEETARRYGYRSVRDMNRASEEELMERAILAGDYGLDYKRDYLENKRQEALAKEKQDRAARKKLAEIKLKAMKEKEERQRAMVQQLKTKEDIANEAAQAIQDLTEKGIKPQPRQVRPTPLIPVPVPTANESTDEDKRFKEFLDNVIEEQKQRRQRSYEEGGPDWLQK
jgi:hypothetical protein